MRTHVDGAGCERHTQAPNVVAVAERKVAGASAVERSAIRLYRTGATSPRPDFLWGWVIHALEVTELPGVRPDLMRACRDAKFLGTMLDVVLDDVADTGTRPDIVATLLGVVFEGRAPRALPEEYRPTARLGRDLMERIDALVQCLPGFDDLDGFLAFDQRQLGSALLYASLVNSMPSAANVRENTAYLCHNMNMMVHGTIDLMARDDLRTSELGDIRELLYVGQLMGRIGNAVTTWPREAEEGDVSSTVFPVLRERGGWSVHDLRMMSASELARLDAEVGAEKALLASWEGHRTRARRLAARIGSFDAHPYVRGLETLLALHHASRGLK